MGTLLSPDSKYAQNGLVNCLIETSRFPEALALLDELLATQPEDVICHRARVHALQGLGKEREAAVAMETLKRMGQLKTQDLLNLGDLYHNLNLYELSLQNYQLAIEKKERISLHRYVRAASILMNRASYEDCFQYLEKIQQILGSNFTPEDERKVLLLKAEVLQATGQTKESTAILRKIVEMHPLEGKALIMLGRHAWQDKDYVLASLHFERASKIDEFEAQLMEELLEESTGVEIIITVETHNLCKSTLGLSETNIQLFKKALSGEYLFSTGPQGENGTEFSSTRWDNYISCISSLNSEL